MCEYLWCDYVVCVFFDVFLNCVIVLFYVVWKKYWLLFYYEFDCDECYLLLLFVIVGVLSDEVCDSFVVGVGGVFDEVVVGYVFVVWYWLMLVVYL